MSVARTKHMVLLNNKEARKNNLFMYVEDAGLEGFAEHQNEHLSSKLVAIFAHNLYSVSSLIFTL